MTHQPDKPDDHLAAMTALRAALDDLFELLARLESVEDFETRVAVRAWVETSRLRDLWGPTRTMH